MDSNVIQLVDAPLCDQDIIDLFMGLVRLVRRQYQDEIDTLRAQLRCLLAKSFD